MAVARAVPFADGQVLVQFKPKAQVSAASTSSLGVEVLRVVGGTSAAGSGAPRGGAVGGAATAAAGPTIPTTGAVVLVGITDGSSVEAKVKELTSNPGKRQVNPLGHCDAFVQGQYVSHPSPETLLPATSQPSCPQPSHLPNPPCSRGIRRAQLPHPPAKAHRPACR